MNYTYYEQLEYMKKNDYTFLGDIMWEIDPYNRICYCSEENECYHYKILMKIYNNKQYCSFRDRFKPQGYVKFKIDKELFKL